MSAMKICRQSMVEGDIMGIIKVLLYKSSIETQQMSVVCIAQLASSMEFRSDLVKNGAIELLQALKGLTTDKETRLHCDTGLQHLTTGEEEEDVRHIFNLGDIGTVHL